MLENWKNALNGGDSVCVWFMDFSNIFDTINYDLLLAKLKAHGFLKDALTLIFSDLKVVNKELTSTIELELLDQNAPVVESQPNVAGPS